MFWYFFCYFVNVFCFFFGGVKQSWIWRGFWRRIWAIFQNILQTVIICFHSHRLLKDLNFYLLIVLIYNSSFQIHSWDFHHKSLYSNKEQHSDNLFCVWNLGFLNSESKQSPFRLVLNLISLSVGWHPYELKQFWYMYITLRVPFVWC